MSTALSHSAKLSIRRLLIFVYLSMTTHLDRRIERAKQVVSRCSISMTPGLASYYLLPFPTTVICENREILLIGRLLWFLILLMLMLLFGHGLQSPSSKLFGQWRRTFIIRLLQTMIIHRHRAKLRNDFSTHGTKRKRELLVQRKRCPI